MGCAYSVSDSQATRRSGSLAGRTVVVIGGTSGIGEATALSAAASGALVYVAGRHADRVASCVAGHEAIEGGFAIDIADPAAVGDLFRASGVVDHVVVTAGDVLTCVRSTPFPTICLREGQYLRALR
jgi:NAD(P)-dependent dehydrogenase (short-subunit alcohol dehydrogenase family)